MNKKILGIIPARGGSKRLPNKNILLLNNIPLINYTIKAATDSKYIDTVVVSSDNDAILDVAKKFTVETIKRDPHLAQDDTSTADVVMDVLNKYPNYDFIVLLQPTSPLRTSKHVDEAIDMLYSKNSDAIVSVCEMEHSPLWSNTLDSNQDMSHFISKDIINKRSQELETYYRLNGAIYIINKEIFLKEKRFLLKNNIYAYIMDQEVSIDIDTKLDFIIAQSILNLQIKGQHDNR